MRLVIFLLLDVSPFLLLTFSYQLCLKQSEHTFVLTLNMFFSLTCLFLPMINAIAIVKIHQSAIYQPVTSCTFLRNISWSTDASIQSCIWECVHENNCQTAVYSSDEKICSMFGESCNSDSIQPSGNFRASVICYPKSQGEFILCYNTGRPIFLSTFYYLFFHCDTEASRPGDNDFFNGNEHYSKYVQYICF